MLVESVNISRNFQGNLRFFAGNDFLEILRLALEIRKKAKLLGARRGVHSSGLGARLPVKARRTNRGCTHPVPNRAASTRQHAPRACPTKPEANAKAAAGRIYLVHMLEMYFGSPPVAVGALGW